MDEDEPREDLHVPSLPIDLIFPILHHLVHTSDRPTSTSALEQLCLVSRLFRTHAQPLLYASPHLTPASQIDPRPLIVRARSLARTLQARPDLAATVRHLDLGKWTNSLKEEARTDRRAISLLAVKFVELCPGLRSLNFPNVSFVDVADLSLALAKCDKMEEVVFGDGLLQSDPWVVNLDPAIRDQFGSATWTIESMRGLMVHWPELRRFELKARLRSSREDQTTLPCRLEAFQCDFTRQSVVSAGYVDRMLRHSVDTLKDLTLTYHQLSPGSLLSLVKAYGANLTSFALLSKDPISHDPLLLPTLLSHAPKIHHLVLGTRFHLSNDNLSLLSGLPLRHLELRTPAIPFPPRQADAHFASMPLLEKLVLGSEKETEEERGAIAAGWSEGEVLALVKRMALSGVELVVR
ncbi:hypothetical protein MNV49_001090 [Pseudohyphozyma bogoriensis]|nr:hypothetical protein MNV49_001090 [Pseudohyphozyma bogoriensis]